MTGQQRQGNESLITRVLNRIVGRRENVLSGNVNCIPSSLVRFRGDFVGIQQARYYLITAHQKGAKTQFTSWMFIYEPLLYAYRNPDKVRIKIFWYPLEETKETITLRFMSFLLYTLSNHSIRISPEDLESTNENKILDERIIELLKSDEYQKLLNWFEEHVIFEESSNPTGMHKDLNAYARENGTIHTKELVFVDKQTGEKRTKNVFDYYEPNDPNEYVMIVWDHISLTTPEKGMDLRNTISTLSEYMVDLRNRYGYIPVIIQQQSTETQNLDAFKNNKIRPTVAGLADCKYTARDCNVMLGLSNPYAFEIPKYQGYDIMKMRNNIRFLEVVVNRNGNSNGMIALYFDGAVNFFAEMPAYDNEHALNSVYNLLRRIREEANPTITMFFHSIKKTLNFVFQNLSWKQ